MTKRNDPPTETSTQKLSRDALWENIEKRIEELIEKGALANIDVMFTQVQEEFDSHIKAAELPWDKKTFIERVGELVWKGDRDHKSKEAVRSGVLANEYQKFDQKIPLKMVEERFQELRGVTTKRHPPTFLEKLRHTLDPATQKKTVKLPEGSFARPVKLDNATCNGGIDFFNGLQLGTIYNPLMEENWIRRAFSEARKRKVGAIILTNVLGIHTKKTVGQNRVELSAISGHLLDEGAVEVLDPEYREEALGVLKEIRENPKTDRMVYLKPFDVLLLTLRALYKIVYTHKNNEKIPEYDGPVYIVLSQKDDEIVRAHASARARDNTVRQRGRLDVLLRLARTEYARRERDDATDTELAELAETIRKLEVQREYTKVDQSSVANNERRYAEQALSALIRGYREVIPNCTVIGIGTTYIQVGNTKVEINVPGDTKIVDAPLARYNASYGAKVQRNEFADAVVICPQYSLNYQQTDREHTGEGPRKSSPVFVAPTLLDDSYVRKHELVKNIVRASHPLLKLVHNELTATGLLHLDFDGAKDEIVSPATFPMSALRPLPKIELERPPRSPNVIRTKAYGDEPCICIMIATDPHRGGRAREIIWSPEKRMYLGVFEATLDLMERSGLYKDPTFPVPTFEFVCDDIVQGLHFPAYSQTHPHLISQGDMEKLWAVEIARAKASGSRERMESLMETMHRELAYQRRIQGTDWVEHQLMEASKEMFDPYALFYHLMVANAVDSGLELTGMSKYEGVRSDERDLGFINYVIAGNHIERTTEGHVAEGNRAARDTRFLMRSLVEVDRWRKSPAILETLVRAVNYSGEGIGGVTVKLPGGKPWGIMMRSTPTTLSSWGDPLGAHLKKELQRGDHLGFQKYVDATIAVLGDKHFGATRESAHLILEMGPAGTHTDRYGQRGFPPNNTGVKFVLIPAGGPGRGPILRRTLMAWNLRYYLENPKEKLDWKKFLPNVIRAG